jgi:hypothetical protein
MQTYITENRQSFTVIRTVRPNIQKVFIRNLLYISGAAAGIILILVYLNSMVGLDVFLTVFQAFGITVDPGSILSTSILVFLGIALLYLIINYLNVINLRYEFYDNRIRLYEPQLWLFLTHRDISYKNIVKISYNYEGLINKLFRSGEIVIDVTGMKEGFVKMEVIDDTQQLVGQLLKIVQEYNSLQQMQFQENFRIGNIMRRF